MYSWDNYTTNESIPKLSNLDSRWLPNLDSRWLPNLDSRWLPNIDSRWLPNLDSRWLPNLDSLLSIAAAYSKQSLRAA